MEPVPDSIALIIAQISLPRTSPTIWRERLKRKESTSASSRVNSPGLPPVRPALTGARPGLPGVDDLVAAELVEVQLVLGLEGADRLERVDLGAQGADQRGLAGSLRAGDDDELASPHRGAQERGRDRRQHVSVDEVVERDLHQPVASDHDRRSRRHPRRGGEPRAAVEPQVQPRLGLGEAAGVDLAARGKEDQEVDQLLVGVGDRWAVDRASRRSARAARCRGR